MRRFRFSLEGILRLRAGELRKAEYRLAQALQERARCAEQVQHAHERYEAACQGLGIRAPAWQYLQRAQFREACQAELAEAERQLAISEAAVQEAQRNLAEQQARHRLMEDLKSRHRLAYDAELAKAEQDEADDMALMRRNLL